MIRPVRYCPMEKRKQLPIETVVALDPDIGYRAAETVRRCLCMTVGNAGLVCDPHICGPKLIEGIKWAQDKENFGGAVCGVSKKIFREYNKEVPAGIPAQIMDIVGQMMGDDD